MSENRTTQHDCIEVILEHAPESLIISNLGVSSWVLASVQDREKNYYMRGGMGGTTPTGLGVALSSSEDVIVLEGDGSLLMSLGCLSTVGEVSPDNFTIAVMDNSLYETTGKQKSASGNVDLSVVAEACGVTSHQAGSTGEFESAFEKAQASNQPTLIECFVEPAEVDPPDNYDYGHTFLTHRFRSAVMK